MKSFQMLALMGAVIGCTVAQQYPSGALGSYSSQSVSTTPRPLPPAQVHYVNIGEDLTGDYKFGYDTGKNDGGQSFREESRLPDGTVKGAYGYIDAEGKQRIVKYTAGIEGFKVESDEAAPGPASSAPASRPAPQQAPAAPAYQAPQTYTPRRAPAPAQASYQPQSLGGYTAVAPQQRYVAQQAPAVSQQYQPQQAPQQQQAQPQYQPQPQYQAPSPLPNYSAALQAQLAAAQASGARQVSPQYRPQPAQPQYQAPSAVPSYTQTLAQRQPTLSQARPSHLASIPRSGSSSFGNFNNELQESTTWGPPVINKELLSYNIGVGR